MSDGPEQESAPLTAVQVAPSQEPVAERQPVVKGSNGWCCDEQVAPSQEPVQAEALHVTVQARSCGVPWVTVMVLEAVPEASPEPVQLKV